jgi:hypothetical protein
VLCAAPLEPARVPAPPAWTIGSTLDSQPSAGGWPVTQPDSPESWYAPVPPPSMGDIALPLEGEPGCSLCKILFPLVIELAGFYDPFTRQFAYGSAGVQGYRLGWFSYNDFVYMPSARASDGGNFKNLEWNAWLRYSQVVPGALVFAWTLGLNGEFWTGPKGIEFPPDGGSLISDFQLASNWGAPWNWQLGVTPQIDSDFSRTLNSNSLMCDVRAVALFRPIPEWTLAFGAALWNRATDHLIPYGGVIWSPNERWEFRLLYPRTRISYYVGNVHGMEAWGYVSLEYNIEAYQLDLQGPPLSVRGEFSEYRLLKGFNLERGRWNFFWEGGAVFDRHVRFRGPVHQFGLNDGLILRTGITY